MGLPQYYGELFPEIQIPDMRKEEIQLLKNSGMLYVEYIILQIYIKFARTSDDVNDTAYFLLM